MDCDNFIQRRVKLGYVADSPTSIQLIDSIGNQVFDLLPIIQAGETDTSIELISDTRRIRYYPEEWTRTEGEKGCYYDICIPDIAALIDLNELRNVENPETLRTGDILYYNAATQKYEMYNLIDTIGDISTLITNTNTRIDNIENRLTTIEGDISNLRRAVNELTELVGTFQNRLTDIENAIYNWTADKTTKIPRGNINVTSGGYNSGNGIYTRAVDTNEDLNFS